MSKQKCYYLIDTENVGNHWTRIAKKAEGRDRLVIFYSENHSKQLEKIMAEHIHDPRFRWLECTTGKDALDYQLMGVLSYLVSKGATDEYHIISNDKGFKKTVEFWSKRGVDIRLDDYDTNKKKKEKKKREGEGEKQGKKKSSEQRRQTWAGEKDKIENKSCAKTSKKAAEISEAAGKNRKKVAKTSETEGGIRGASAQIPKKSAAHRMMDKTRMSGADAKGRSVPQNARPRRSVWMEPIGINSSEERVPQGQGRNSDKMGTTLAERAARISQWRKEGEGDITAEFRGKTGREIITAQSEKRAGERGNASESWGKPGEKNPGIDLGEKSTAKRKSLDPRGRFGFRRRVGKRREESEAGLGDIGSSRKKDESRQEEMVRLAAHYLPLSDLNSWYNILIAFFGQEGGRDWYARLCEDEKLQAALNRRVCGDGRERVRALLALLFEYHGLDQSRAGEMEGLICSRDKKRQKEIHGDLVVAMGDLEGTRYYKVLRPALITLKEMCAQREIV